MADNSDNTSAPPPPQAECHTTSDYQKLEDMLSDFYGQEPPDDKSESICSIRKRIHHVPELIAAAHMTYDALDTYPLADEQTTGDDEQTATNELPQRLLSTKELVAMVLNAFPIADAVIDPVLLETAKEPAFYKWLKSNGVRTNPDALQLSELLALFERFREENARVRSRGAKGPSDGGPAAIKNRQHIRSLDELRRRVRAKIVALEVSRNKASDDPAESDADRAKRVKKEMKKLKKEDMKIQRKKEKLEGQTTLSSSKVRASKSDGGEGGEPEDQSNAAAIPIFNRLRTDDSYDQKAHPRQTRGKNYKRLIGAIESKRERIRQLAEQHGEEVAAAEKKKQTWHDAMAKADGARLNNDPVALQRAARRQEKRKKSSAKKWDSRIEQVEHRKQVREERRKRNLATLQNKRKDKRVKRAVKKGHVIPGFSNM